MSGRRATRRRLRGVVAIVALALALAGCGSEDGPTRGSPADATITVSAAASLTEAFTEIGTAFEAAEPGTAVELNFGSSGTLATQIAEGAPADVVALAATEPMDELAADGLLAGEPEVFARNELVIVTKPGNPKGIEGLADLADVGVVALCVATAPCGSYADRVLADAGVEIPGSSVTRGQDVKATLAAVTDGDAEAGIVYVTDAARAGSAVASVAIPAGANAIAAYPIAVVADAGERSAAEAFVAFVLGPEGRAVLRTAGFASP